MTNWYRTRDHRWLILVALQADRYWAELCALLGREHLIDDPRYADAGVWFANDHVQAAPNGYLA